ncbi:RNA polymerase sigma factor [Labrenzia sp. PHM005]|uniref:RNA polymerase sigma factor n=1 Tax=Labrenzia sp. PHM005 TaxID=2590016 RepID=UPI00113FE551|nr:RNA polymerase sigma factor [Labrenzia sp. PHM005]QDG79261.1 RNA polymerase sigma factor [Labrenzia sp. PHM005]
MHGAWLSTHVKAARPRVLAALNRYFQDIDLAEDAFQEASIRAVKTWSDETLPKDPVAWLIVAGRNYGIDQIRKRKREALTSPETFEPIPDETYLSDDMPGALDQAHFRDDVVRLLFTCCHPILRKDQQIALALKIVAGLSVDEIARAFLVQPKTMEQRITRAKKKIQAAKLSYEEPDATQRTERLQSVANAIYLVFNEGYSASQGEAIIRETLCDEAIRLARLLVRLFPEEPELKGLLSLCLVQHSRSTARVSEDGMPITLDEQDRNLWDKNRIAEGTVLLETALLKHAPGPLQIEAAIAATHARAKTYKETDWAEIERLYRALDHIRPSPVVKLNRAVVLAKINGQEAALRQLEPLASSLSRYASFHAAKATLLAETGNSDAAKSAFEEAIKLAGTETERAHLLKQLKNLK